MSVEPKILLAIPPGQAEALESIVKALDGDTRLLASRVRGNVPLREDERAFLADYLEGKTPRPETGRSRSLATFRRQLRLAVAVQFRLAVIARGEVRVSRGAKTKAVVAVAEAFGCNDREVWRALKMVADSAHLTGVIGQATLYFKVLLAQADAGEKPVVSLPEFAALYTATDRK